MSKQPRTPPLKSGDRIVVRPDALVAGGDAIARIDGFPMFVPQAYPGDEVEVVVTEVKKGFARGEVSSLRVASPDRRAEPCPVASECGGCDWTELRLDAQLRWKREILRETLRRIGGRIDAPPIALHPSPLNYRIRSRLHADSEGRLGFYARRSHRVVPLPAECEVVGSRTITAVLEMSGSVQSGDELDFVEGIDGVVVSEAGEEEVAVAISVASHRWQLSSRSFFQVNRHQLATLLALVEREALSVARRRTALDLYGGVGFFAVPLSKHFERVVTVESGASSRWALVNAEQRPITVERETVERFLDRDADDPDFVVVDPPRAGLGREVVSRIAALDTEKIAYLSCDPVTLARDLARFDLEGWRLASLDLIDLFPNTHHIETFATLIRGQ